MVAVCLGRKEMGCKLTQGHYTIGLPVRNESRYVSTAVEQSRKHQHAIRWK